MKFITILSTSIATYLNLKSVYVNLIIQSLLLFLLLNIISKIIIYIYAKSGANAKNAFLFKERINIIINIIIVCGLFIIWEDHLKNIITLISFISAGVAIAVKEVILNLIAGVIIKTKKTLKLEDRVEINEMKGDVVALSALSFKILEVNSKVDGEQSTGLIINIPNSFIFTYALKNYTTAFKYIWDEMTINLPLDADVEKTKKIILKIVNNNDVVKAIPKKMTKEIEDSSLDYHIYYNHLEPIIYTSINLNKIVLKVRFLVHPKKVRIVEDDIWLKIIKENNQNNIRLYKENQ